MSGYLIDSYPPELLTHKNQTFLTPYFPSLSLVLSIAHIHLSALVIQALVSDDDISSISHLLFSTLFTVKS